MTHSIRLGIKCKIVSTGDKCPWHQSAGQVVTICAGPHDPTMEGWEQSAGAVWSIDRPVDILSFMCVFGSVVGVSPTKTLTLPATALQPLPEHDATTWDELEKLTGWQPSEV